MLSETLEFVMRNKLVILFYLAVILFVILNRKKFHFQFGFIALYRARWGIGLMDSLSSRFRELIKLLGYVSIGLGFTGMFVIVGFLVYFLYLMFTTPNAPAAIAPVLPGVRIPGVPFYIPLIKGVLSIFIVAVIHEFAHGVVARAHNVKVKNTGIGILGPIFIAFVEPDEKQLRKKSDVVNYSIFAAGPVSNFALFGLIMLLLFAALPAVNFFYPSSGIEFTSVTEGSPADLYGLKEGTVYDRVNGQPVLTVADFISSFGESNPGDVVEIGSRNSHAHVKTAPHPEDPSRPYLGVILAQRRSGDSGIGFGIVSWITDLLRWTAILSLGIGLGNLIPLGPIDGGRMLQQALHKLKGERSGNKALIRVSILLLLVLLILLYPIFRETFRLLTG